MSKDVINQHNVKSTLQSNEIKRFHQVSENFLKGSHHFMVEFQQSIIKSVDTKIIHSDFMKEYQDSLEAYRREVLDKVKDVEEAKEEQARKSIAHTIMNFVIAAEVAVLAFTLMPKQMKAIGQFAMNIVEGIGAEIQKIWNNIDFNAAYETIKNMANEYLLPIGEFVVDMFWEFFNGDNNVFTRCMYALAKSIIKRGKGPLGWMLKFAYSFLAIEGLSKPDIKAWLLYGPEIYKKVELVNNETHSNLESFRDTSSSFFDASNAEIGIMTKDDDGNQVYMGVDEGYAWLDFFGTAKELEDTKEAINQNAKDIQKAVKEISTKERVDSLYGVPNLFETDAYKNLEEQWEDLSTDDVDIQAKYGDIDFKDLVVNLAAKEGQEPKKYEELRKAYLAVCEFRYKYGASKDPFVKSILTEIREKIDGYIWSEGTYQIPMPLYLFLPSIYYCILQYEFVTERNEKLVASLGREMNTVSARAEAHLTKESKDEFDYMADDVKSGRIDFKYFADNFINYIEKFYENPNFSFTDINFNAELSSKFMMFNLGELILKGFNQLKGITESDEKYNASSYIEVTKDNIKQFQGEIQIGNEEVLLEKLVSNDRKLKQKIKNNYIRRKLLTEALVKAVWMNLYVNGKLTSWEFTQLYATNPEIRSNHNDGIINGVKGVGNSIYNFFF